MRRFIQPQPQEINQAQRRAVAHVPNQAQNRPHLLGTQNVGNFCEPRRPLDPQDLPRSLQGLLIKELDPAEIHRERARCHLLVVDQMQKIPVSLPPLTRRRPLVIHREVLHRLNVTLLRPRRQMVQLHVLVHLSRNGVMAFSFPMG